MDGIKEGISLAIKGLTFISPQNKTESTCLLNNINMIVESGQVLVLMGPFKLGRAILLKIIKGNMCDGIIAGDCFIGGVRTNDLTYPQSISLVSSENFLEDFLTVEETLHFSTAGYLKNSTFEERCHRVDTLLKVMNLMSVRSKRIHRLSVYQSKKVSIAVSLVNSPCLLILDEPCLHLTSYECFELWSILKTYGENERIPIIWNTFDTLHYSTFARFDLVFFLCHGGRCPYFGPPMSAFSHIFRQGYLQEELLLHPFCPTETMCDLMKINPLGISKKKVAKTTTQVQTDLALKADKELLPQHIEALSSALRSEDPYEIQRVITKLAEDGLVPTEHELNEQRHGRKQVRQQACNVKMNFNLNHQFNKRAKHHSNDTSSLFTTPANDNENSGESYTSTTDSASSSSSSSDVTNSSSNSSSCSSNSSSCTSMDESQSSSSNDSSTSSSTSQNKESHITSSSSFSFLNLTQESSLQEKSETKNLVFSSSLRKIVATPPMGEKTLHVSSRNNSLKKRNKNPLPVPPIPGITSSAMESLCNSFELSLASDNLLSHIEAIVQKPPVVEQQIPAEKAYDSSRNFFRYFVMNFPTICQNFTWDLWFQMKKEAISSLRDYIHLFSTVLMWTILGVFIGGTVWQLDNEKSYHHKARANFLCFLVLITSFSAVRQNIQFLKNRKRNIAELERGFLNPLAVRIAQHIVQIPIVHAGPTIFFTIVYFMAGLNSSTSSALSFCTALNLCIYAASAFLSFVTAISSTNMSALTTGVCIFSFSLLTSGMIIPLGALPQWTSWSHVLNWMKYTFSALMLGEFLNTEAEYLLRDYSFLSDSLGNQLVAVYLLGTLWKIVALIAELTHAYRVCWKPRSLSLQERLKLR